MAYLHKLLNAEMKEFREETGIRMCSSGWRQFSSGITDEELENLAVLLGVELETVKHEDATGGESTEFIYDGVKFLRYVPQRP